MEIETFANLELSYLVKKNQFKIHWVLQNNDLDMQEFLRDQ